MPNLYFSLPDKIFLDLLKSSHGKTCEKYPTEMAQYSGYPILGPWTQVQSATWIMEAWCMSTYIQMHTRCLPLKYINKQKDELRTKCAKT